MSGVEKIERMSPGADTIGSGTMLAALLAFVFGTPLVGLPSFLNIPILVGLATLGFLILSGRFRLPKCLILYSAPMVVGIVYGSVLALVNDSDLAFEKDLLRNLFYAATAASLALPLAGRGCRALNFLEWVAGFLAINALVIFACFLVPKLQPAINSVLLLDANEETSLKRIFTYNGLLPSRGASGSLLASLYFLYFPFAWGRSRSRNFLISAGALAVLASIFFIGRTGFVSAFFLYCAGSLLSRKVWLLIPLAVGAAVVILVSYLAWSAYFTGEVGIVLNFALEPVISVLFEGAAISETNETLSQMFYLPVSTADLLLGSGAMLDHEVPFGYLKSDSGYVRWIHEQGVILMGMGILCWFYLASRISAPTAKRMFVLLLSVILLTSFKEPFLFKPGFSQMLSVTFFMAYFERPAADHFHHG